MRGLTADGDDPGRGIVASWQANAEAWTAAVRGSRIPSRVAGTERAIVDVVRRFPAGMVLDAGCGEGWLARSLSAEGYRVSGIDVSARLVEQASALGGGDFRVLGFDDVIRDPSAAGGPYGVVVLNYALFTERLAPLLTGLAGRLIADGALIVQTVHPWLAAGDAGYVDGWREENFASFGVPFPAPMPWYFRTMASWGREIAEAGLAIARVDEPRHPETGVPLSMILTLRCLAGGESERPSRSQL